MRKINIKKDGKIETKSFKEKKVRYIRQIDISEPDKDHIEPICYLNVFEDLGTHQLFGWKEYDYMRTKQNLKSNEWKLRDKMWVAFIPNLNRYFIMENS